MIKVSCKSCGHSLGAPSRYAGKKVKCPKCQEPIRIPQEAGGSEKAGIIKFRCSHCGQKIGLPQKYAGKDVTCAKCRKPVHVPGASASGGGAGEAIEFACDSCGKQYKVSPEHAGRKVKCKSCGQAMEVPSGRPQAAAVAADDIGDEFGAADDMGGMGDFGGDDAWAGDLLAMEAAAPEVEGELRVAPPQEASAAAADEPPDFGPAMGSTAWSSSSGGGGGLNWMFSIPTGIVASFLAALLGALIWAGIACATGFELGIVAIGVGALTGGAMMFFSRQQSVGLGVLAAFFALVGIFMGKVFIAKWYVLPQFKEEVNQVDFTSEELQEVVSDDDIMFGIACMELVDQGEFSHQFAFEVIAFRSDETDTQGRTERHDQAIQQADELLASWTVSNRQDAVQRQYTKLMNTIGNALLESGFGVGLAFIGTLSLFDILWVILALGAAYKAGAGGD